MVKYLTRKGLTFWYRRRVKHFGEVVFSLDTKNFDLAMLRHSYIDYKITQHIIKGTFETMDTRKIQDIIDGYKQFMKSDAFIYGDEGDARNKALEIEIEGEFYGGHTKTALLHKLTEYGKVSQSDDIEKVKAHTEPIIDRSDTLKREFDKLDDEKERDYFHWKLLKAEVWALNKALKQQDKYFGAVEQHLPTATTFPPSQKPGISISKLTKKYIQEKSETKEWSDKNERDIKFVLNMLEEYFLPKTAEQLTRDDFLKFRNEVLPKVPQRMNSVAFRGKDIHEIIKMTHATDSKGKSKKIEYIGKTTINKHIGRVNQVFAWAADEAGLIEMNYCSNLRYSKPQTAQQKKTNKLPFTNEDLKRWFEQSPNFTTKLKSTLANKPEFIFIPLIALYLGARNAELTQLHYRDIKQIDGIWCICITDFKGDPRERKRTKNEHSRRNVPIAQGLIEIGFLKYVQKQKNKLLFPNIKYSGKDQEPIFTKDINAYIREHIRQENEKKTFLSFRHMVNQKLKDAKTPLYIINDITGHNETVHGENDIDIKVYGEEQMPLEILKEVIDNSLIYDEIDFSHIKEEIHRRYS